MSLTIMRFSAFSLHFLSTSNFGDELCQEVVVAYLGLGGKQDGGYT